MDVPLDSTGRAQAEATAQLLKTWPLAAIYSSPLSRARETAGATARLQGLKVVVEEPFTNLDLGPWTGRKRSEVADEEPENWRIWIERPEELVLPGAETLDQVAGHLGGEPGSPDDA
jgi:probable phosphoglycerate mutase